MKTFDKFYMYFDLIDIPVTLDAQQSVINISRIGLKSEHSEQLIKMGMDGEQKEAILVEEFKYYKPKRGKRVRFQAEVEYMGDVIQEVTVSVDDGPNEKKTKCIQVKIDQSLIVRSEQGKEGPPEERDVEKRGKLNADSKTRDMWVIEEGDEDDDPVDKS